jgi:flagella basal body P-ring formation protein FlgA
VRVVVPSRDIARGETISDSDLSYAFVAANNVMPGTATSMESIMGMQARRTLRTGFTMRNDDVRPPLLVLKGSTVTMVFDAPGVTLTAMGRAMSEGGLGETVTVQNPASFRQITAVVTGPGTVKAQTGMGGMPQRVASNKH